MIFKFLDNTLYKGLSPSVAVFFFDHVNLFNSRTGFWSLESQVSHAQVKYTSSLISEYNLTS